MNPPQILLLVGGILLVFFGLLFYKSFVKLVGFVVGGAYGLYLFTLFMNSLNWDPIFIMLAAAGAVLILGILGTYIATFANVLLFFLAGGMIGVLVSKLIMGVPADTALQIFTMRGAFELLKPAPADLIWFLGGGIMFVLALDWLVMILLTVLGAVMIRFALAPLDIMKPDWVVPGVIGLLGLMFQEAMRRRTKTRYEPLAHARRERKAK
jgi:hypothetical protein